MDICGGYAIAAVGADVVGFCWCAGAGGWYFSPTLGGGGMVLLAAPGGTGAAPG